MAIITLNFIYKTIANNDYMYLNWLHMTTHNYIKRYLDLNNVSQAELARTLKIDKINFNKIVNNKRSLDIELAKKIAKEFKIHWAVLYQDQPDKCKIHGYARKDWQVNLVNPLKHTEQFVTFKSIATIDLNNVIIIEEVGFFALHIFEKKPYKYPCQAINLIEDGKNNWFMAYYKTSLDDHNAYNDKSYLEYDNLDAYYYDKSGLAYWQSDKKGLTTQKNYQAKKNYSYYHVICTEFDANYDIGYHYKDKPKGIKF